MTPPRRSPLALTSISALFLLAGSGCDMSGVGFGGSQDIELARELIEAGGVPRHEQFTPEGLFAQHDIPTPETEPCAERLCPRASVARIDPVDGAGERVLVQLALATEFEQIERQPVNLALVVDISGSMAGDKFDSTKLALHSVVDQLDADDRLSLVSFGSAARIEAESTIMDAGGRASLHAEIDALAIEGATNIEDGLSLGYSSLHEFRDGHGGNEDRVMLFTDAQPNIGATGPSSFVGRVQTGADLGVGISVFGVGLDLGAELTRRISEVRGGNSFFLASPERIATVFDDEFDAIVTPLAYGLQFRARPLEGFSLLAAYGTPDADATGEIEISAATAFASTRGGAMAVVLDGDLAALEAGSPVVHFALDYETPTGEPRSQTVEAEWLGGDFPIGPTGTTEGTSGRADHAGGAKLAVLLDEFFALEAGADVCAGTLPLAAALERIAAASERLDAVAELLDDEPLADEAALMRKLAANLQADGC